MELQRYGRGPDSFPYILTAFPDGYWTPWHVADAEIRRLKRKAELTEEGSKEAFGAVVQQKRDAEAECKKLRELLELAYTQLRIKR